MAGFHLHQATTSFVAMLRRPRVRTWLFPAVVTLLVLVFGGLQISGSSVGVYYRYFYGSKPDPSLIFGYPQPVRGDEWNTITPILVSQARTGYHLHNPDIGLGEDMSVILNVPYKNWLVIFQPWNVLFLILPLATAFALSWWFLGGLLAVITYFLALKFLPGRHVLAVLISIFLTASPMIQWWYRSYILVPVALAFAAVLICIRMVEKPQAWWAQLGWSVLLGYLLAVFVFVEYPPFQDMSAIAAVLLFAGWLLKKNYFQPPNRQRLLQAVPYLIGALLLTFGLLAGYYLQDKQAILALAHTTYPGKRVYPSGQAGLAVLAHLLASPFSAELQRHTAAAVSYWANQSEASLFIEYSPLLLLPAGYVLVMSYRRSKKMAWDVAALVLGSLIFYAYLFVPHLTAAFSWLLLDKVPPDRLFMGIGLLDFLLLLVLSGYFAKRPLRRWLVAGMVVLSFIVFTWAGLYTRIHNPGYIQSSLLIYAAAAWMALALGLLLLGRLRLGWGLLTILTLISVVRVNPLYKGLSPLTTTPLSRSIQSLARSHPNDYWLTSSFTLQEYPLANGAKSITGDYSYPQFPLWRVFDPQGKQTFAYNRALHALAQIGSRNSVRLLSTNTIELQVNPCSSIVRKLHLGYFLTTAPLTNRCLRPVQTIAFPAVTTYIYAFPGA